MGIPAQDILSQDPEILRRQLFMREMQTLNPQGTAAGAIGALLGRGLGNVASGQGFFAANDPALQRAAKVRSIQTQIAQSGETDPTKLATLFADELAKDPELAPFSLQVRSQIRPTAAEKPVTVSPGQQIVNPATGEVIYTAPDKPKDEKITPLDLARQSVLTLGARDPNTLSQTERNELSAATTLLRLNAPGTTVNVGDKSVSVAAGKAIGEAQAAIDNKFSAITSLKNAKKLLDAGIYAGPYAPLEKGLAKYTGGIIGSKKKVVNTERFLSEIGNVVIPRLQEFGGNDSVEELKYLKDVQGGRIDLEPETLRGIIESAENKIQAGIERLKAQSDAIEKGERLPLGPMPSEQQPRSRGKTVKRRTASGIEYEIVEE